MNHHPLKIGLCWVLLSAVLCFALPGGAEEYILPEEQAPGQQAEYVVVEIPGVDVLQEYEAETSGEDYTVSQDPLGTRLAEDYSQYAGEWDAQLGLPVKQVELANEEGFVTITPGVMNYNRINDTYRLFCGDAFVTVSLPAGAVVNRTQDLVIEDGTGLVVELYRDGSPVSREGTISKPGNYVLYLNDNMGHSASYSFILVDKYVNDLNGFLLPDTFAFTSVEKDGEQLTIQYLNYFELVGEGDYVFQWHSDAARDSYTTRFTLDRTAPVLALPQVRNGISDGRVTLTDLEQDAVIRVIHEGQEFQITDPQETLSDPGQYILTVTDRAGNSSTYHFRIKTYINLSGGSAILLLLAALAGLLFYSRRLRKNPRFY